MNWHYSRAGEKLGPITAAQLKELATTNLLAPDDLVWREDMKEWRKASSVKGLFPERAKQTPTKTPPPVPPTDGKGSENKTLTPKRLLLGCLFIPVLIALLLPAVQQARDAARKAQAERQFDKSRDGSARTADSPATPNIPSGSASDSSASTTPTNVGTLEEMGEKVYDSLPFARVDQSPDISPIPLAEDFAQSGTFRFRQIIPDITKTTMSQTEWENMTTLGYKERTEVREFSETYDLRLSDGEPNSLLEWHSHPVIPEVFPIIRIGAMPGDKWEWTNQAIDGTKLIFHYTYNRCVQHNGIPCVMIESEQYALGIRLSKHIQWYARGVGLVKKSELENMHGRQGGELKLFRTQHRIMED